MLTGFGRQIRYCRSIEFAVELPDGGGKWPALVFSSCLRGLSGAEQLEQVGRQAHQLALATNVHPSARAEAPKASPLFDLSEDRLDDGLAHLVNGSPGLAARIVPHRLLGADLALSCPRL